MSVQNVVIQPFQFFFAVWTEVVSPTASAFHTVLIVLLLMWNLKSLKVCNYKVGSYLVVQFRNW